MNNEEKILEMLVQIQTEQRQMREEQVQMREEQVQMREEQVQMREEQKQMRDDLNSVKLRLELDVEKRFDTVNEGIDCILERMTPKSRVEELEADVIVLKGAIKMLSQEVAELKKAQ